MTKYKVTVEDRIGCKDEHIVKSDSEAAEDILKTTDVLDWVTQGGGLTITIDEVKEQEFEATIRFISDEETSVSASNALKRILEDKGVTLKTMFVAKKG